MSNVTAKTIMLDLEEYLYKCTYPVDVLYFNYVQMLLEPMEYLKFVTEELEKHFHIQETTYEKEDYVQ